MTPLKLRAEDREDLQVISSALQDSLVAVRDVSLAVEPEFASALRQRLDELARQEQWPWQRVHPESPHRAKQMDLRVLVQELSFDGRTLTFTLVPRQQAWARVEEVLALLGLDEETDRARLTRTVRHWETAPR